MYEGCTYQHINKLLTIFYTGGVSSTMKEKENAERRDFFYNTMPKRVADELYNGYTDILLSVQSMRQIDQSFVRFMIRTIQWFRRKIK